MSDETTYTTDFNYIIGKLVVLREFTNNKTQINEINEIISELKTLRDNIPPEISDEEIEKCAEEHTCYINDFIMGAKWYREQLKQRQ